MNDSSLPRSSTPRHIRLDADAPYLANAYHLARIARAVYADEPVDHLPVLEDAFDRIACFQGTRVFGFVAGNDEDVVVTFRGRDDNQQLAEAMAYGQVRWVEGRAHGGFVKLLETVWEQILAAFYDVRAHEKRLWVTGHSLGGALAALAAQRLYAEGFEPHMVMTYGAPRVLDEIAATAYPVPLYRFVNNEDVIPDIPWPTLFDTYAHAGREVFVLPSGAIAEPRHSAGLARKIDRANTIGEGIFLSGPFHDHTMTEYVDKLARYAHDS